MYSVTLSDLIQLADKHEHFETIRIFSCHVLEMRMLSGEPICPPDKRALCGIELEDNGYMAITHQDGTLPCLNPDEPLPEKNRRWFAAHILQNGIFEINSRIGTMVGGIDPGKGVHTAKWSLGEHERDGVCALVTYEEKGEEKSCLYLRNFHVDGDARAQWWMVMTHENEGVEEELVWINEALGNNDCVHQYRRWATTGRKETLTVLETCTICGEERKRPGTDQEKAEYRCFFDDDPDGDIHAVYHEFSEILEILQDKHNYSIIEMADEFTEVYHEDTQLVPVDDEAHCGSSLVLIDHENDREYWGTTVVYLPQCSGVRAEFFLYPHHRRALIKALQVIEEKQQMHEDGEE